MTCREAGSSVRPESERRDVLMPVEVQDEAQGNLDKELIFEAEPATDEARLANQAHDPGAPTERELREHVATHLPPSSWCMRLA